MSSKKKTPSKQEKNAQMLGKELGSLLALTKDLKESTDMGMGVASVLIPHQLLKATSTHFTESAGRESGKKVRALVTAHRDDLVKQVAGRGIQTAFSLTVRKQVVKVSKDEWTELKTKYQGRFTLTPSVGDDGEENYFALNYQVFDGNHRFSAFSRIVEVVKEAVTTAQQSCEIDGVIIKAENYHMFQPSTSWGAVVYKETTPDVKILALAEALNLMQTLGKAGSWAGRIRYFFARGLAEGIYAPIKEAKSAARKKAKLARNKLSLKLAGDLTQDMTAAVSILSDEKARKGLDALVGGASDNKKAQAVIVKFIQLCGLLGESGITSIEALNNVPVQALIRTHKASIEEGSLPAIYHWNINDTINVDDLFMASKSLDKFLTKSSDMATNAESTAVNPEVLATNMSNCIVALVVAFAAWKLFSTNAGISGKVASNMLANTAGATLCLSEGDGRPPDDVARWLGDCKTLLDLYTARELFKTPGPGKAGQFHLAHLLEDPFFSHLVLLLSLPICRTLSAAEDLVRTWDPESVRLAACRLIDGFHAENQDLPICIHGKTLDGLTSKIMQDRLAAEAVQKQELLRQEQEKAAEARRAEEAKTKEQAAKDERERQFATEQNTRRERAAAYHERVDGKRAAAERLVRAAETELDARNSLQRHKVVEPHISEMVANHEAAKAEYEAELQRQSQRADPDATSNRESRAHARGSALPKPPLAPLVDLAFFDTAEYGMAHVWPTFNADVRAIFRVSPRAMVAIRVLPGEVGLCLKKLLQGDDSVDCHLAYTYELGESLGSLTGSNNFYACTNEAYDSFCAYPEKRTDSYIVVFFKDELASNRHLKASSEHFKNMGGMVLERDFDRSIGKGEEWRADSKLPGGPKRFSTVELNSCLLNMSGSGLTEFPLAYALTQFRWTQRHGFTDELEDDVPLPVWSPLWGQATPDLLHACSQLKIALSAHGPPPSPGRLSDNARAEKNEAENFLEASELFHTAIISGEMCAGMSRTESAELLQLLVRANAAHGHSVERLIAAHETEEKFRRHKDGYAGQYDFTAFMSEKDSVFQLEHHRASEQTAALGVVGLPIHNLSDRNGNPEKALHVCPMAKFDESDTLEKVLFFF